jgi:uncharacterized membrane protein/sporulation protein YlmC with PRC-barrel domain
MRELPVDAKAVCTDGDAGHVTDVIVDPVARKVTHVVIRESRLGSREFIVPLERVIDSSMEVVRLGCTTAELAQFPEFTSTRFVSASSPEAQPVVAARELEMWTTTYGYEPIYLPYVPAADETVPITEARVPEGNLAFERGARAESSDGAYVGDVEAFVIRPDDASITHFVLHIGSTGRGREVTLPISTVGRVEDLTVKLSLTKAQIEQLPSVPAGGKYRPVDGQPGSCRLVSIVFDAPGKADEALRLIKAEVRSGRVGRAETAVVRKGADGHLHVHEDNDLSAGRGAVAGAVAGGLLSLVAGPVGLVGAAAVGAAAGGLTGKVVDRGVPDRYVRDLGRALRADSSAIVLLVDEQYEHALLEAVAPLGGQLLRLALSDDMLERLVGSVEQK